MTKENLILSAARIVELSREIKSMEAKLVGLRKELDDRDKELEVMLKGLDNGGDSTLTDQVVEVIDREPSREFSPLDIITAIPDANPVTIRSVLPRLAGTGRIVKSGRGVYRAKRVAMPEIIHTEPSWIANGAAREAFG